MMLDEKTKKMLEEDLVYFKEQRAGIKARYEREMNNVNTQIESICYRLNNNI
jgi:hypothetical protein